MAAESLSPCLTQSTLSTKNENHRWVYVRAWGDDARHNIGSFFLSMTEFICRHQSTQKSRESTEALYSSNLTGLMALNQISLMSFWRLNPGRDYTTRVPCFSKYHFQAVHAGLEAKQQPPRTVIQLPQGREASEGWLCRSGLWQHQPMARLSLWSGAEQGRAGQSQAEHHFCSSSAPAHAGQEQDSWPLVQSTLLATGEMWITTYPSLPHRLTCVWACREVRELTRRPVTHSEILGEHS